VARAGVSTGPSPIAACPLRHSAVIPPEAADCPGRPGGRIEIEQGVLEKAEIGETLPKPKVIDWGGFDNLESPARSRSAD